MNRDEMIGAVSSLSDPNRRAIFDLVASRGALARDDVAAAVGLPRSSVAFHLDRLVAAGMLTVANQRRSGRTGPGAGRPAKIYSVADGEIAVTVPPRQYDLMASLLASAIEHRATGEDPRDALGRISRERGRQLGAAAGTLDTALVAGGYAPVEDGAAIALHNCPFHQLVATHRDLVCRANHALLCGVAEGVGDDPTRVVLEPVDGQCCVRIRTAS